jgi:hypothetical protein
VENVHAVRQKAENFVEGNFLLSDVELWMWKCSGTISIKLCRYCDWIGWEGREETEMDMDYTENGKGWTKEV